MSVAVDAAAPEKPFVQLVRQNKRIKRLATEFFGGLVFVFLPLGAAFLASQDGFNKGLSMGLVAVVLVALFAHISGGHFNPAVTLGSVIAGRLGWLDGLWYVIAQVVGGAVGGLALFVVLNQIPIEVGAKLVAQTTQAAPTSTGVAIFDRLSTVFGAQSALQLPIYGAALAEVVATALLVGVVLAAFRPGVNKALAPLAIGFTYFAGESMLTPLAGGGMNPARSIATALFAGGDALSQLWIFILAPLVGAAIAGLVYRGFVVPEGDGVPGFGALVPEGSAEDEVLDENEVLDGTVPADDEADALKQQVKHDSAVDSEATSFFDVPKAKKGKPGPQDGQRP